jgi:phosphohistidine phosphatase SixA
MSTIYLMRHSQAAPSDYRTTDNARWLTAKGRTIAMDAGRALAKESGGAIDIIVASPLARAVQTAELVAQCLGWTDQIRCLESLRSESSAQRAIDDLQGLEALNVLAVSHEPIVSTMSALLTGQSISDFRSGFRPAEICCHNEGAAAWRWRD